MFFYWLKKYMPRGLYGRSALILLVPVVAVQAVVLVAFSQRYFDDVTQQLMVGLTAEAELYVVAAEGLPPDEARVVMDNLDARLEFVSQFGPDVSPVQNARVWYDVSGRSIMRELRNAFPHVSGIDLASDQKVLRFSLPVADGHLLIEVPRSRASARNPHQLLVLTVFTGVLLTLVSIVFLRNQLRPIRRLARAAEAFGRGDVVNYRLAGATEVRSAGAAFLNMRSRIERMIDQRTLMLSGVSHDLRTPLTRMRLALSMLEAEGVAQEEIDQLRGDLDEMSRLIDEFLDFARADSAEEIVETDMCALVSEAISRTARGGGLVEAGQLPQTEVQMRVRQRGVARAFDNLLSNALRYGTRARVSLYVYERSVVVSVEDDGPGIAPDAREQAVQPFVRLDASRNQDKGSGVGLGLAIATDIVRRHGGSLRLGESDELGGLRADIVLPR